MSDASAGPEPGRDDAIDFGAEGLLDGLEAEPREERLALLHYLSSEGVSLAELQKASTEGTLMFLPADRAIGGPARYTREETLAQAQVKGEFLDALNQAIGLPLPEPEERVFTEHHVEAARLGELARRAGITEEEILDVTRVLGRGLAQAAEVMRTVTLRLVLEPGLSERELAERFANASRDLAPMTAPLVGHILIMHLLHMAQIEAMDAAERSGGELPRAREIAVCFADLVGFTRRGEEVLPDELGRLAGRLETITEKSVRPPVVLVKTIGDAVMLVCPEPDRLLDTALDLVEAADAEGPEFPQLRVGIAAGAALRRAGDWFGRPVNLASRVTGVARPGSVLATREVHAAAEHGYRWSFAGERRLKGVKAAVPLYRARRAESQ